MVRVDAEGELFTAPSWLIYVWSVLVILTGLEAVNELFGIGGPSVLYEVWFHDLVIAATIGLFCAAAGIFLTEGTVSLYNWKVLRGSAGSIFRLPFLRIASAELISLLRLHHIRLLATSSHQGVRLPQVSWTLPLAIFIGNEGAGLPRELMREMDATLAIPHAGEVESLNAGIAASIILYEAARKASNG